MSSADLARTIMAAVVLSRRIVETPSIAYLATARRFANPSLYCSATNSVFAIDLPEW